MRKISETEENNMYSMLQDSIFSLCEKKPENSINFLSKKLLEYCDNEPASKFKSKSDHRIVNEFYNIGSQIR
jgi:hypothetical protein